MAERPIDPDINFAQLVHEAWMFRPRFPIETSGRCPSCGQGGHFSDQIQTILWWFCDYCGCKWSHGESPYTGPYLGDDYVRLSLLTHQLENASLYEDPTAYPMPTTLTRPAGAQGASTMPTHDDDPLKENKRFPLQNLALRLAARSDERAAATPPAREPTADERAAWAATLAVEDAAALERRARLRAWYIEHAADSWVFWIAGEKLSGPECAMRLRAGAPFFLFYQATGTGQWIGRRS